MIRRKQLAGSFGIDVSASGRIVIPERRIARLPGFWVYRRLRPHHALSPGLARVFPDAVPVLAGLDDPRVIERIVFRLDEGIVPECSTAVCQNDAFRYHRHKRLSLLKLGVRCAISDKDGIVHPVVVGHAGLKDTGNRQPIVRIRNLCFNVLPYLVGHALAGQVFYRQDSRVSEVGDEAEHPLKESLRGCGSP